MRKQNKGFTLVELLAVIVILALIMVIAVPSVLKAVNAAKKEEFFLYAQSLQSKSIARYIQDLDEKKENTDCAVYDIGSDLGLSDTGKYEGWVRVKRVPSSSGKRSVSIDLSSTQSLQYVKYCVEKANSCTPTTSYLVEEDKKATTITQSIDPGYVMCANYQYKEGDKLRTSSLNCKNYSEGIATSDSYDYQVVMTIKDASYAVEETLFNKDMSMENFYKEIDKFKEVHKDRKTDKLAIAEPSCNASENNIKGTTTTAKTTQITTSSTESKGTQVVTTSSTESKSTQVVTTSSTESKGTQVVTTSSTSQKITSQETSPTIDVRDESLLLRSLTVSGYDIQFNQLTFHYDLIVPNSVTSLNVSATPMNSISTVTVTGNNNLGVGTTPVVVELFNTETGKRSFYRIIVKRLDASGNIVTTTGKTQSPNYNPSEGQPDPTIEESDASLKMLTVSGYIFEFDPNVYEYTLETNGEKEMFVSYRTSSKGALASVSGDKDVQDGSQIVVYVQSQNGYYSKSYTIKVVFKKQTSTGTKVIRGAAVGLGVVLLATLAAISLTKKRKGKTKEDKETKEENNNNPEQGSV